MMVGLCPCRKAMPAATSDTMAKRESCSKWNSVECSTWCKDLFSRYSITSMGLFGLLDIPRIDTTLG